MESSWFDSAGEFLQDGTVRGVVLSALAGIFLFCCKKMWSVVMKPTPISGVVAAIVEHLEDPERAMDSRRDGYKEQWIVTPSVKYDCKDGELLVGKDRVDGALTRKERKAVWRAAKVLRKNVEARSKRIAEIELEKKVVRAGEVFQVRGKKV